MTQETLKEIGKFLIDLSKITIGVAFLTPLAVGGFILINKGTIDD